MLALSATPGVQPCRPVVDLTTSHRKHGPLPSWSPPFTPSIPHANIAPALHRHAKSGCHPLTHGPPPEFDKPQKFDKDGDGFISLEEVREALAGIGHEDKAAEIMRRADENGDGRVDYVEVSDLPSDVICGGLVEASAVNCVCCASGLGL